MKNGLIGGLLGIVIVIGGAAYFWFDQQQQINQAKEAARQAAITKQKNQIPAYDLSAKEAGKRALENLTISKVSNAERLASANYFALTVKVAKGENFAGLLHQFYNKPTSFIVMTAEKARGPKNQLPSPILILETLPTQPPSFNVLYAANGQVLPFESSTSGGGTDIALDIHYLDDKVSKETISTLVQMTQSRAESLNDAGKDAGKLAAFLKQHQVKFFDNLMQLHIGPEGKIMSGRKISLKETTGSIELNVKSQPAKFVTTGPKGATLVKSGKIDLFLQRTSQRNKELQVNFWLNEGEGFVDTCRDLTTALKAGAGDEDGLSLADTSVVLWSLIHRHAWFAKNIDYQTDCLNKAQSAALQELKLALPTQKNTRQSGPSNRAMNARLTSLVKVLRDDASGNSQAKPQIKSKAKLEAMIAEKAMLLDRAGLWLFGEKVKQNASGRVFESADQKSTIEQLYTLPISRFGCFSRGEGLKGRHRRTLAQFDDSPDLWELEFAFNTQGKIAAITLDEATSETICRAIGNRRSGTNACYFARHAKQFPVIAQAKCGR